MHQNSARSQLEAAAACMIQVQSKLSYCDFTCGGLMEAVLLGYLTDY